MARWSELRNYILANYKVHQDHGRGIVMLFSFDDGRSQLVTVTHHTLHNGSEDWVVVESPIGKVNEVDLSRALSIVGGIVCGGIGRIEDFVTLRDAFPLANLDLNEFERPLRLITASADEMEKALLGEDAL